MVLDAGVIASICHTPGPLRARSAECGVWTRPGYRGRGYAAAGASAWAEMLWPSGRLGTLRGNGDDAYHPLSRLRHGDRAAR